MLSRVESSSVEVSVKTSDNTKASCGGRNCLTCEEEEEEDDDNDDELLLKAPAFSWFQFTAPLVAPEGPLGVAVPSEEEEEAS